MRYLGIVLIAFAGAFSTMASANTVTNSATNAAKNADGQLPTGFTENSQHTINYHDWNLILSGAVLDVGLSDRRPASRSRTRGTSSRIRRGNTKSTAFEGNRVLFYEFKDDHIENLIAIRRDLEAVHDFVPLEEFSRNEQLAYWYNLHNIAVMIEVAKAYPIKKIKRLSVGKKNVWDVKTMTVAGIPTSIRDIERHVIANWNSPMVLYGFFMGAVGGPNIRTEAFTGDNVLEGLQANAIEFVNSLRGFRFWSGQGRVSDHYEMGKRYFPNFQEDMKKHLMEWSRPDTRLDVEKTKSFKIKGYDWGIADLKSGDTYSGGSFNADSRLLAFFTEAPNPQQSANALGPTPPSTTAVFDGIGNSPSTSGARLSTLSPQVSALLRAMKIRNQRRAQNGTVSVEEYVNDEGGRVPQR